MKKFLYVSILFIAACFIEGYATNYTYKSFIKEGSTKEWKTTDGTYLAQGDTVINSVHYTKLLYAKNDTDYEYFAALKEFASWNNLIVYIVFKGEAVPKILYEFNKEESENFDCGNDAGRVTQRKMVTIRGIERVSYTVIPLWEKTTPVYTLVSMYDGIGLIKNPFDIMSDGYLLLCRENGIVLYEKGDEIKDYEPFLVEGKKWLVTVNSPFNSEWDHTETYLLQDEETIDDVVGMKMYRLAAGDAVHVSTLYEKDRKVYFRDEDQWKLLYDFGLDVGESTEREEMGDGSYTSFVNNELSYEEQDAVSYKKMQMKYNVEFDSGDKYTQEPDIYWIEGVGSTCGPTYNYYPVDSYTHMLISCTRPDGRQYVTEYGKMYLEGIHSIQHEELKMNNEMFDLQGRRVTHPNKGEIYIQKGLKVKR